MQATRDSTINSTVRVFLCVFLVTAVKWNYTPVCSCCCWCSADSTPLLWMDPLHLWDSHLSCPSSWGGCQSYTRSQTYACASIYSKKFNLRSLKSNFLIYIYIPILMYLIYSLKKKSMICSCHGLCKPLCKEWVWINFSLHPATIYLSVPYLSS